MKKLFSLLMVVCMLASAFAPAMNAAVLSEEDQKLYDEYVSLVKEGVIGEDVDFEMWSDFIKESIELERQMSEDVQFELVYDSSDASMASVNASYSMKEGDVLVTNGTASSRFLGHAGIVINNGNYRVLHTSGRDEEPYPLTITLSFWHTRYTYSRTDTWTKIYRHKTTSVGKAAAEWAMDTYMGSTVPYQINADLYGTDEVYCSKLVWQAYYYGPTTPQVVEEYTAGIIGPYQLKDDIKNISLVTTVVTNK